MSDSTTQIINAVAEAAGEMLNERLADAERSNIQRYRDMDARLNAAEDLMSESARRVSAELQSYIYQNLQGL